MMNVIGRPVKRHSRKREPATCVWTCSKMIFLFFNVAIFVAIIWEIIECIVFGVSIADQTSLTSPNSLEFCGGKITDQTKVLFYRISWTITAFFQLNFGLYGIFRLSSGPLYSSFIFSCLSLILAGISLAAKCYNFKLIFGSVCQICTFFPLFCIVRELRVTQRL